MKSRVFVFLFLLALPLTGFAQTTLNFPKFFSATDLPNSGFAIVNPGSASASVTFTLYATNGSVVAQSTATSYPTLGPGTQQAELGTQIFCPQSTTACGNGGWVQATSSTSGLQGFWLTYNGSLTYVDGAATATPAVNQTIPLVAGNTTINVANPNVTSTTVSLELHGAAGNLLAPAKPETISGFGVFNSDVFSLFGIPAPTQTCYLRVLSGSTNTLAATAFITNYLVPVEAGVINGVDESSTATTLNFPQVASGPANGPNYTTQVGVTNLSNSTQTVTVTFFNCPTDTSTTVAQCTALTPVSIPLAARGSYSATAQSLFGLSPTAFAQGWIQMTGTAPIAGFAAYADLVDGALAVVPGAPAGATSLMFAHIANLYPSDPWETGIALLNPSASSSASVQIYAMTPAGILLGGASTDATATLTIPPLSRSALGLSQMIPEAGPTSTHTSDGGFIYVQSSVPIFGAELFYNPNVSILANVAAGTLATGITYTPPSPGPPPSPVTLTSVSPAQVAVGGSITLSGTGFSSIAANNTVTFSGATAGTTTSATAQTATSTTLTLFIPNSAITGPVTVTAGGVTSNSVILEILASPTTVAQNSVFVTAGSTVSGADIYVDPPAASAGNTLIAAEIGVAAVGAPSISYNDASAQVTQGTQVQMLIYGSGISAANGTTVTFSGSGITVSNVTYGTLSGGTYMTVQIAIASGAAIGPRNVILTNSNLDVSVLSGGLIIVTNQ